MGSPLTLDIVSHSRGLVGRVLAERAADVGLAGKVTVRNLVMVAAPNAGTALADKAHLSQLMDRVTDLVQFLPDAGVTDAVGLVLSILKQISVAAFGGLEGIMAMDPAGEYLRAFNTTPGSAATYRAIASNYQPVRGASLARVARNAGTDFVFQKANNDLVVPTDGVFRSTAPWGSPSPTRWCSPRRRASTTRRTSPAPRCRRAPGVAPRLARSCSGPIGIPAPNATNRRDQAGYTEPRCRVASRRDKPESSPS